MKDIKIEIKSEFLIKEEILDDDPPASSPLEQETKQNSVKNAKSNGISAEPTIVLEPQGRATYLDNKDSNRNVDSSTEKKTETNKIAKSIEIFCNQCQTLFVGRTVFENHYRNQHKEPPIFSCKNCSYNVGKYQLYRAHFNRHFTKDNFKCNQCSKQYQNKSDLKYHKTNNHGIKVCKKCNEQFENGDTFREHVKTHGMDGNLHSCSQCGKILMTIGGLYTHRKMHEEKPRFKCDICEREFFQKVNLMNHTKTHEGTRPFSCNQCDKAFFEKSHLQRHLNFHTLVRSYKCPTCEKCYKTERCLKVHSAVHSTFRPFVCCVCNKGFLSSSKLKQHFNIHTGERPFKCKHCTRDFTNYPNLLKHTIRRHKVDHKTGEKLESIPDYVTNKKRPKKGDKKEEKSDPVETTKKKDQGFFSEAVGALSDNKQLLDIVKLEVPPNSRKNSLSLMDNDNLDEKEFHINDNSNDFDMYAAHIDEIFSSRVGDEKLDCAVDFSDILMHRNDDTMIQHDISTTVTSLTLPFYSFPENSNQFQLINPNLIHLVNSRHMDNSIDT